MQRFTLLASIPIFLFLLFGQALAGSFKVSPTSVKFGAGEQTAILKLTNQGDEKVTIQVDAKEWLQSEKTGDQYQPTKDIVIFPKIFTILKGEQALVRVGHLQEKTTLEKAFRIFLQELPVAKPGEMTLKMALTLSVPLFIGPQIPTQNWELTDVEIGDGTIQIKVKNAGNTHVINNQIILEAVDDAGKNIYEKEQSGWYVLAGATKIYSIDFPLNICLETSQANIDVFVGREMKSIQVPVNFDQCTPKPVTEAVESKLPFTKRVQQ